MNPTANPTGYPTAHPTTNPTVNPTAYPTAHPTANPLSPGCPFPTLGGGNWTFSEDSGGALWDTFRTCIGTGAGAGPSLTCAWPNCCDEMTATVVDTTAGVSTVRDSDVLGQLVSLHQIEEGHGRKAGLMAP